MLLRLRWADACDIENNAVIALPPDSQTIDTGSLMTGTGGRFLTSYSVAQSYELSKPPITTCL